MSRIKKGYNIMRDIMCGATPKDIMSGGDSFDEVGEYAAKMKALEDAASEKPGSSTSGSTSTTPATPSTPAENNENVSTQAETTSTTKTSTRSRSKKVNVTESEE